MQKTKRVPFDTVHNGELFVWRGLVMQRVNSKKARAVHFGQYHTMQPSTVVEVSNG